MTFGTTYVFKHLAPTVQ